MKINSKGRYAVMALADLAKFEKNQPVSLNDISLRQNISLMYLEQIFLKLKKKNIVNSVRGVNGGYKLSKRATTIKLSEIFHAVDEKIKTIKCNKSKKKSCNGKLVKCNTHKLWEELEVYINDFFENKYLSDVNKNVFERRTL